MPPHPVVQGAEGIGDALTEGQIPELLKISPGFVHNGHDIGALHLHRGRFLGNHPIQDLPQTLWGHVLRLLHLHELYVPQKDRQCPAGAVGPRLVPHICFHTEGPQLLRPDHRDQAQRPCQQADHPSPQAAPPCPGAPPQQPDQPHDQHKPRRHLPGRAVGITPGHRRSGPQSRQVPGKDRAAPVQSHKVVGRPPQPTQDMEKHTAHRRLPGQPAHQKIEGPHADHIGQSRPWSRLPGPGSIEELHQIKGSDGGQQIEGRPQQPAGQLLTADHSFFHHHISAPVLLGFYKVLILHDFSPLVKGSLPLWAVSCKTLEYFRQEPGWIGNLFLSPPSKFIQAD